jgi:DNA polymerase-3 subunit alpha
MRFVSLHHHTTFSYRDGFGTPSQHVDRIADLGMGALALTEHG